MFYIISCVVNTQTNWLLVGLIMVLYYCTCKIANTISLLQYHTHKNSCSVRTVHKQLSTVTQVKT